MEWPLVEYKYKLVEYNTSAHVQCLKIIKIQQERPFNKEILLFI